ncbi:MAG: NAD(P)-dependent oxidoreductase [bacterium]|nr:MAG: NAD(P)-dependent oxidoreductase [bacterium]
MKVLVAGAGGMLSDSLVKVLNKTHDVTEARIENLDITDKNGMEEMLSSPGPEVVINCAAYTDVDGCEDKKDFACAVNADGPKNLAQACKNHSIKLIHISTDYVFDGTKTGPYLEDDPVNPISVYGMSKLKGEENVREQLKDHLIVRTQWLYGESGRNFVKTILKLSKDRGELRIVNDQTGCPTYTDDLSHSIKTLMEKECTGTYHAANSGFCTWYEFALEIFTIAEMDKKVIPIKTEESKRDAARPANSVFDCSKLKRDTGFVFRPWQEALKECVAFLHT